MRLTQDRGHAGNEQGSREATTDRHTLVDAQYGRGFGGTHVTFRASFDRFSYDGTYPLAGGQDDAPALVARNNVVGTRWSVGTGLTRAFRGRQTVRAGVEFIDNMRQDQTARYIDPPLLVLDSERSSTQHAVYVQDEIRLARWLIVNAGLRYDERDDKSGVEIPGGEFLRVTPRAALIVLPSSTQSLKYLYGNAFRAPNAYEGTPARSDLHGSGPQLQIAITRRSRKRVSKHPGRVRSPWAFRRRPPCLRVPSIAQRCPG
jgi:outer membrane receptor protein involved in Fe transport